MVLLAPVALSITVTRTVLNLLTRIERKHEMLLVAQTPTCPVLTSVE